MSKDRSSDFLFNSITVIFRTRVVQSCRHRFHALILARKLRKVQKISLSRIKLKYFPIHSIHIPFKKDRENHIKAHVRDED